MANNSSIQIINSERAVSDILSNFSTDFVLDVIDDNIKMKFRPYNIGPTNFAIVIDQKFTLAGTENPAYISRIEEVRSETHREIINRICNYYNLQFVGEQDQEYTPVQLASLSSTLFDIFVTNFTSKMVYFFARYIMDNKDDIYNCIEDAEEIKKNKEATAYGRRIYSDPKIVVIHSNLNAVLSNIATHDIPLQRLLYYLTDNFTAEYLSSVLVDNNDIYKYHYASYIMDPITRPDVFTVVKFQLQGMADKTVLPTDQ